MHCFCRAAWVRTGGTLRLRVEVHSSWYLQSQPINVGTLLSCSIVKSIQWNMVSKDSPSAKVNATTCALRKRSRRNCCNHRAWILGLTGQKYANCNMACKYRQCNMYKFTYIHIVHNCCEFLDTAVQTTQAWSWVIKPGSMPLWGRCLGLMPEHGRWPLHCPSFIIMPNHCLLLRNTKVVFCGSYFM